MALDQETLGRILKVKDRRKISTENIARELGLPFQTIHRWIKGKTHPSPMGMTLLGRWLERWKEFW